MTDYKIKVTTTGSAGSATGSATSFRPVTGLLTGVKIDYHASAPATTDVTITESSGMARTLLTRTSSATDGVFYPSAQQHDTAASTVTSYTPFDIKGDYVTVTIAECDALTDAVVVTLHTLE